MEWKPPEGMEEVKRYWIHEPHVFVSILYDQEKKERIYNLVEPPLSSLEHELLERIYEDLQDVLTLEEIERSSKSKEEILFGKVDELLKDYKVSVSKTSKEKIKYYLRRDLLGYERIDALMNDPNIEDISCNGGKIPLYLYHREYQNIRTNISFSEEVLEAFVLKLAQISGKHLSIGEPLVNATLPDGSRLQATYAREVTSHGSSFTIRKFRKEPFTPPDLILLGTFSPEILAYLWLMVEFNKNMIFAGGTASGKTTSLNAISLFIPPASKIISIEDTRELSLHHENWIPSVTRDAISRDGAGEVDMYELLRQALRQRPEYLLLGEVRGSEALTLFQAMATGHTTFSTLHASSVQEVISRLESEPMNVPSMMILSLNLIGIQVLAYLNGKRVRRLLSLTEITGFDPVTSNFRINEIYRWNQVKDRFEKVAESILLSTILEQKGWTKDELQNELRRREEILRYLADKNIRDSKSVTQVIRSYYTSPDEILNEISR